MLSRSLVVGAMIAYILCTAAALLWWAPNFFSVNLQALPQFNYRYVAATGVPFGFLLMTIAARQSLMPRLSLVLALQATGTGLALILGIMSFQYLPQSVFFCATHILLVAAFVFWNLFNYRRELTAYNKKRAALAA